MHDGFHRINLATLDGSRWTNPATLDDFTGRIRPCMMAPLGESYRARWFPSYKSCHPALAETVGQIPLGKVRLMKPTAFTSASAIVISTNALWEKHLNNREPRLRGAQSAASPSFVGPNPPRAPIPKRPGHFSTRATIRCGASAPKRQGCFSARHQSAQPVSTSRTKSTQAQNYQPKPPRESIEFISFFAQVLWGLATTLSVAPHSTTSPSSSTRSLSASSDTRAKS